MEIEINTNTVDNNDNMLQNIGTVQNDSKIVIADPLRIYNEYNITFWVTQKIGHSPVQMTVNEIGSGAWANNQYTITVLNAPSGGSWWIRMIQSTQQQALQTFSLNEIDRLRDEILTTPGNVSYDLRGDDTEEITLKKNVRRKR